MNKAHLSALLFAAIVMAAVLGIYLPGLHNELLFDDQRLADGTIFGGYGSVLQLKQRLLSYGSFIWVQEIFGQGWWKQRLVNVALHLGTVAALYVLVRDLLAHTAFPTEFQAARHFEASRRAALRVGVALFAVHPVAVYAVGYLVQRSILMATLFAVLACWFYLRGLLTCKKHWYLWALISYMVAVLSKEHSFLMAVMIFPLYVFIRRPDGKQIKQMAVTAGVSLAVLAVAITALWAVYGHFLGIPFDARSQEFIRQLELISPGISGRIYLLSILNEAWLFFTYGALWFFPNVLWMSIDLRPVFPLSLTSFPHILGGVGYIVLLFTALWIFLSRRGALSFVALCLLFPLLLFLTEFATVWVQDPLVLYRSYLWAIAVPGLIAVVLTGLTPRAIYTLGGILMVVLSTLAVERTFSLRDGFTAWGDAAEKIDLKASPNAVGRWQAFLNLGGYHVELGSLAEARKALTTAQALGETQGYASFNLGLVAQYEKKHDEALTWFARSQAQGFSPPLLHYHRGESLFALGQFAPAYQSLSQALPPLATPVAPPELTKYRSLRAEVALAVQQYDVAINDFDLLLKDNPHADRFLVGLGLAKVGQGDLQAALAIFNPLIAQNPSARAYYGRAMVYLKMDNKEASLKDLDQTIALDPKNLSYPQIRAQIAANRLAR